MQSRSLIGLVGLAIAVLGGCATAPRERTEPVPEVAIVATVPALPSAPVLAPIVEPEAAPPILKAIPLPAREDDLWMRIRGRFALAPMQSPLIKEHENWYQNRPDYVKRMTERSQLYLFHIVEEVERRGLPSEIALLPMTESAFNPKALSRSKASGIWQFISSTGKHFGLDQNWWYDGRRDVLAATNAALDYLEKLHRKFGSWELALAAYNCGEGTVGRAIATNQGKGLPTDYQSLNLSNEARNYVPKLLAVKNIIADPQAFGLHLNDVPNKPFFTTVEISKHIDVALAARFADMSVDELVALNPAYNKPMITYNDSERLLLPTSKASVFSANMRRYGTRQLHTWQAYRASKGEHIDKIAARFGMSPAQLRNLNPLREKRGKLLVAQLLLVPLHSARPLPTAAQIAEAQIEAPPPVMAMSPAAETYLVQKGDTLFGLAKRFGTSIDALVADNKLPNGIVKVGDTIGVPGGFGSAVSITGQQGPSVPDAAAEYGAAAVKPGSVAFAGSVAALGQDDVGKGIRTARPAPATKPSFYHVKRGDTVYSIARALRIAVVDLMLWNNFTSTSKLHPGARLRVSQTP